MNYYIAPSILDPAAQITPEEAVKEILQKKYDTTLERLSAKTRKRNIVFLRQVIQTCLVRNSRIPLHTIGEIVGGQDHATVLNSRRRVDECEYLFKKFGTTTELLTMYLIFEHRYKQLMSDNDVKVIRHYRSAKDEQVNYESIV